MNRKRTLIVSAIVLTLVFILWLLLPPLRLVIGLLMGFYLVLVFAVFFAKGGGGFFAGRINSMIYTKTYLKEKPVMLARIVGLIQQHDYTTAENDLLSILKICPCLQDVVVMLGQLYLDNLRDYAKAEKVTADYLRHRGKVISGDLNVVNLYVDACLEQGKKAEALVRLDYELKLKGYAISDKKALQTRREALT